MYDLEQILPEVRQRLSDRFTLQPVALKYPLPERPWRMLWTIRIAGDIYDSDRFARVLLLNTRLPMGKGVRSVFIGPRPEYDLPVFSVEVMLMGRFTVLLVDVQRRGAYGRPEDDALYGGLQQIRDGFKDLLTVPMELKGEIARTCSPVCCYVKIAPAQHARACELILSYLDAYCALVAEATPLAGGAGAKAVNDYDAYLETVVAHDPAVKIYQRFFGARGGVERALDMFFAR